MKLHSSNYYRWPPRGLRTVRGRAGRARRAGPARGAACPGFVVARGGRYTSDQSVYDRTPRMAQSSSAAQWSLWDRAARRAAVHVPVRWPLRGARPASAFSMRGASRDHAYRIMITDSLSGLCSGHARKKVAPHLYGRAFFDHLLWHHLPLLGRARLSCRVAVVAVVVVVIAVVVVIHLASRLAAALCGALPPSSSSSSSASSAASR